MKRFDLWGHDAEMIEVDDGDWVKYSEASQIIGEVWTVEEFKGGVLLRVMGVYATQEAAQAAVAIIGQNVQGRTWDIVPYGVRHSHEL